MLERQRPRFVETKVLASGKTAFYFHIPTHYRKLGCKISDEPLGTRYETACGEDGKGGRAAALNALFDEWNSKRRGEPVEEGKIARYGTIDWLFRQYKTEDAYTEKVSPRSRPDYERIMQMICDTLDKHSRRIGERMISSVSPRAASKIYKKIIVGAASAARRENRRALPQGLERDASTLSRCLPACQRPRIDQSVDECDAEASH
jgi:hypothetical protein